MNLKLSFFSPKTKKGFTLIEVMLAMAIFAIAGTALLGSTDASLRNLSALEQKMIASWVVSNQLVDASLERTWPPRNKQGKEEMAGHEWYWQRKIIKTTDKNMRAIVVEVKANENDQGALATMMTYVSKGGR